MIGSMITHHYQNQSRPREEGKLLIYTKIKKRLDFKKIYLLMNQLEIKKNN